MIKHKHKKNKMRKKALKNTQKGGRMTKVVHPVHPVSLCGVIDQSEKKYERKYYFRLMGSRLAFIFQSPPLKRTCELK